jgi:hypothetical protein
VERERDRGPPDWEEPFQGKAKDEREGEEPRMRDGRAEDEDRGGTEKGTERGQRSGEEAKDSEKGRKPPPDDLEKDPAYEPDEPLKGIKGG